MKLGALALHCMGYLSKPPINATGFGGKGGGSMNMAYPSNPACLCIVNASLEYCSRSDEIPSAFEYLKGYVSV